MTKFSENDLCNQFIENVPDGWTIYPETCEFDIVLVHNETGNQIGIEAKLRLNASVLVQALPRLRFDDGCGPDFRAVLVPNTNDFATVCRHLGVTVLTVGDHGIRPDFPKFFEPSSPPRWWSENDNWYDRCPIIRLKLPEVVPDVQCGVPSPIKLTEWKIKSIKLLILLDKYGTVTRKDFKELKLSPSVWTQSRWLEQAEQRGHWERCDKTPDLKAEHAKNFAEIEANLDEWLPKNRHPIPSYMENE